MTYRRRSIVIAIVIVLLLSSVVYFVLDARDRCHASIDNTTGDSIPYPVKISIVNSENEQTILYSEEVSLGKLDSWRKSHRDWSKWNCRILLWIHRHPRKSNLRAAEDPGLRYRYENGFDGM